MIRYKTQQIVYLTPQQKALLRAAAQQKGIPETQIVRDALEAYLASSQPTLKSFLNRTAGLWKHRQDISSGATYERDLREEWAVREHKTPLKRPRRRNTR